MKNLLFVLSVAIGLNGFGQTLTGSQLLDRAIAYHDPDGNWKSFDGSFQVTMETPNNSDRVSIIQINLPEEYFKVEATRDTLTTSYTISKKNCEIGVNGNTNPSKEILKEHQLSCERANLYKDYYTYLYGLPMKLKDPGTNINPEVETKTFKGKEYLVLKVTYSEEVGKDVWFFYFDPETYAMKVYQFFKGDPLGEGKNTGEYIHLSEESVVNGIKMPRVRAWYYNKNDEYLGTDSLKKE